MKRLALGLTLVAVMMAFSVIAPSGMSTSCRNGACETSVETSTQALVFGPLLASIVSLLPKAKRRTIPGDVNVSRRILGYLEPVS